MRIILVRHGEPDYRRDCLTPAGLRQAEAAAERLADEGIEAVFSSPMGRARETAGCTARRLQLPVTVLPFLHEIDWGGPGIPEGGHPWTLGSRMIDDDNFDFRAGDWRQHPFFAGNAATPGYDAVAAGTDAFLAGQGYRREGTRYRCLTDREPTLALFGHGGSGACLLAHTLGLPFPWTATVLPYGFASVTVLNFPCRPGEIVHPRLELFNDEAHVHRRAE